MSSFFSTDTKNYSLLILRVALGVVMLPHGLQKAFGMFGGPGIQGTLGFLGSLGIPAAIAFLVILAESLGALGLIFGFLTRLCAAAIAIDMLGAIALVHFAKGFFAGAGGYEMHVLMVGAGLALALAGGGAWSVDGMIPKKQ